MFESFFLVLLLILALYVVLSDNLLRSNIYLGVFSLTMALAYLFYNAPDVALAEAAIGVGLSTVMYLVALKKITVYDICFIDEEATDFDDDNIHQYLSLVIRPLEVFIEKIEEIEPQISYSNHSMDEMVQDKNHDLFLIRKEDQLIFYGHETDEIYAHIRSNIQTIVKVQTPIAFHFIKGGA